MTSAPNIFGATQGREKPEEKAHHHLKVQGRCLARTSISPWRAPLLPAGSALHYAFCMLEPMSVSSPGLSHTTVRGQLLCSFQSFYSASAQAVCMHEGKKKKNTAEWDHFSLLISDIQPASQGYWNKAGKLFFHSKPSGWHRLTLMLICWFLSFYYFFFFLRNTSSAAVNSDLLPLCAEHSFCTHIYYRIMRHCRCQEIIVILGVSTLF